MHEALNQNPFAIEWHILRDQRTPEGSLISSDLKLDSRGQVTRVQALATHSCYVTTPRNHHPSSHAPSSPVVNWTESFRAAGRWRHDPSVVRVLGEIHVRSGSSRTTRSKLPNCQFRTCLVSIYLYPLPVKGEGLVQPPS